jgi:hypothetical protein
MRLLSRFSRGPKPLSFERYTLMLIGWTTSRTGRTMHEAEVAWYEEIWSGFRPYLIRMSIDLLISCLLWISLLLFKSLTQLLSIANTMNRAAFSENAGQFSMNWTELLENCGRFSMIRRVIMMKRRRFPLSPGGRECMWERGPGVGSARGSETAGGVSPLAADGGRVQRLVRLHREYFVAA